MYTQHLLTQLAVPGTKVEDLFKRVRAGELRLSDYRLVGGLRIPPWR